VPVTFSPVGLRGGIVRYCPVSQRGGEVQFGWVLLWYGYVKICVVLVQFSTVTSGKSGVG